MQKYQNSVASLVGRPVVGATVTVLTFPGLAAATIYSDNGISTQSNPITTDNNGSFSFYAADGRYSVTISGNGIVTQTISDILLEDPVSTLALPGAAATVGSTGPSTVQTDIDARPTSATLAASNGAAGVGFIQAGTGAVARTLQDKDRERVSVKDFGAKGDGVTDDAAAIQAALTALKDTYTWLHFPQGTYRSSTALDATAVKRIRMDGEIYFYNSTDGLTVGRTSSVTTDMAMCDLKLRVRGPTDVAGITGIICRGIWRSEVTAHVDGFEFGFEHRMGTGEYAAGNTLNLTLRNSRVKLRFNVTASAFCSDNRYQGLVALKQSETLTPTIGVEWADNTGPCNNNVFDKAWLEGNDTPVKFAGECSFNKFWDARLEGAGNIVFTTGGVNGGASGNLVTSDKIGDGLSFWHPYTTDSPFPNYVDSRMFANERTLISEITYRDWYHRTATANRNFFCPKLVSKLYGNAGGFTFGPDYFDWATIDTSALSFKITNNDEGSFDIPVNTGQQFFLGVHRNISSVASNASVIRLEALDSSKAALATLAAGQTPYFGTTRTSSVGHSGTGNTLNLQNDRVRLSTGVRINRSEVKFLRVVLLTAVEFYKVSVFAIHDKYSYPGPAATSPGFMPLKYITDFSEAPDFTGQMARIRGVDWPLVGYEAKWRGQLVGRTSLSSGTVTVSLGVTMPSTAYHVLTTATANETVYVSAKTTTTFTISSSNSSSTNQVEYIVSPV